MNHGKAIRIARSILDLSQATVARESGIDRAYLSLIESGKRPCSDELFDRLAVAMCIPIQHLRLLGVEASDPGFDWDAHIAGMEGLVRFILEME